MSNFIVEKAVKEYFHASGFSVRKESVGVLERQIADILDIAMHRAKHNDRTAEVAPEHITIHEINDKFKKLGIKR